MYMYRQYSVLDFGRQGWLVCGGFFPPPKPNQGHIYESKRHGKLHWHGCAGDAIMECRFNMKDASDWLLNGAENEDW